MRYIKYTLPSLIFLVLLFALVGGVNDSSYYIPYRSVLTSYGLQTRIPSGSILRLPDYSQRPQFVPGIIIYLPKGSMIITNTTQYFPPNGSTLTILGSN